MPNVTDVTIQSAHEGPRNAEILIYVNRRTVPRRIRLATVPHLRGLPMTQDPKLNCVLACIVAEKADADDAFLTGTLGSQIPVSEVGGRIIGTGRLGPVTVQIRSLCRALVGVN